MHRSHQRLFCILLHLSKVAKYSTSNSWMAFCHLRCHLRWSIVFCDLSVILTVPGMAPLIVTPVGVALRCPLRNALFISSWQIPHLRLSAMLNTVQIVMICYHETKSLMKVNALLLVKAFSNKVSFIPCNRAVGILSDVKQPFIVSRSNYIYIYIYIYIYTDIRTK